MRSISPCRIQSVASVAGDLLFIVLRTPNPIISATLLYYSNNQHHPICKRVISTRDAISRSCDLSGGNKIRKCGPRPDNVVDPCRACANSTSILGRIESGNAIKCFGSWREQQDISDWTGSRLLGGSGATLFIYSREPGVLDEVCAQQHQITCCFGGVEHRPRPILLAPYLVHIYVRQLWSFKCHRF